MKAVHHNKYSNLIKPLIGLILIIILILLADFFYSKINSSTNIDYGVTFSTLYAKELGLDPGEAYRQIITDLGVKKIRLPIYWPDIEPMKDQYDFRDYEELLDIAGQHQVKIIPVIGLKVPRWPECFAPAWTNQLEAEQFRSRILKLVETTVNRLKNRTEIVAWQVENEPTLTFGVCPAPDEKLLRQEVAIVKKLDSRPVIVTDAGERGWWITAIKSGDIFGTTLYRTVWDQYLGRMTYPIPAFSYPLRHTLIKAFLAPASDGIIISELQAEPWLNNSQLITQIPLQKQLKDFPLARLKEVVNYAANTGIKEQYFWGVEWWYWIKLHGHPEYWDYAKGVFNR